MTSSSGEGAAADAPTGTVLSGTGGVWRIRADDGATIEASLPGTPAP